MISVYWGTTIPTDSCTKKIQKLPKETPSGQFNPKDPHFLKIIVFMPKPKNLQNYMILVSNDMFLWSTNPMKLVLSL